MTPMRNWVRVLLAGLLVTAAVVALVVSRSTSPDRIDRAAGLPAAPSAPPGTNVEVPIVDDGPAPSIEGGTGWLNTEPLTDRSLRGTVVLYEFWTFGCINCRHVEPYVRAWYERYHADGLEIVAIHTPEFSYEADPANVEEYVRDHGITYPVALDPDRVIWREWNNHAWPAFALYDGDGRLRHDHRGEGRYQLTEDLIRSLLGVDPASPRAEVPAA